MQPPTRSRLARPLPAPHPATFSAVVPLPRRWIRARTWAQRARIELPDPLVLTAMRRLERLNRG